MDTTPIDEKGHTAEQAQAQEPLLDLDAPAASQEQPGSPGVPTGDVMVAAQTPEEVQAQIDNPAGTPGETHDLDEQLADAADASAEDAEAEDDEADDDLFGDDSADEGTEAEASDGEAAEDEYAAETGDPRPADETGEASDGSNEDAGDAAEADPDGETAELES